MALDDNALQNGLSFINDNPTTQKNNLPRVRLVSRKFNDFSSTYPSEIVNCRSDEGRYLQLYCKYSKTDHRDGHRKGIIHESRIYEEVLQYLNSTTPMYYGTFKDPKTGYTCLVLEYISDALGISRVSNGLLSAAHWLGKFHKKGASFQNPPLFLEKHDRYFYLEWSRRTASFASQSREYDWITSLSTRYEENIDSLLSTESTIIHGEFYPSNVLSKDGVTRPVDWESAIIAAGELDLAALIEGWSPDISEPCVEIYLRSRWPRGIPQVARKNIAVARLYWHFRWLGESPAWTKGKKRRWRVAELRRDSERLDLI